MLKKNKTKEKKVFQFIVSCTTYVIPVCIEVHRIMCYWLEIGRAIRMWTSAAGYCDMLPVFYQRNDQLAHKTQRSINTENDYLYVCMYWLISYHVHGRNETQTCNYYRSFRLKAQKSSFHIQKLKVRCCFCFSLYKCIDR